MRIISFTLYTNDLEAQSNFFRYVFDLEVEAISSDEVHIEIGWSRLMLKSSPNIKPYHYCFLVPNTCMEDIVKWAVGRLTLIPDTEGKVIHQQTHWDAKSIYFYDSDGNLGEFISRSKLHLDGKSNFKAKDITCINEIGMPLLDIAKAQINLSQTMGSVPWIGNDHRFGTHGSEEGLLLLPNPKVKTTWYPTEIKIESAPFEALLEVDGKLWELNYTQEGKFILHHNQ